MPDPTAITIGNFDGVHWGHLALVQRAVRAVGPSGRVLVLSFDPHPVTVLRPGAEPHRLSSFQQRRSWLEAAGATEVISIAPTTDLLGQDPHDFVADLVGRYSPSVMVEGPDFRFGRDRAGSVQTLQELGRQMGFEVQVLDPVERALTDQSVVVVRSSMIRWLIAHGRVRDATCLLGRPFELCCRIVRGNQRGRDLDMPTANLAHGEYVLPADGIYAGVATASDGKDYPAAISVGTKPTFGEHPRTCEAHLLGFDGEIGHYGWTISLRFHDWIRGQISFEGIEPLIAQMKRDVQAVEIAITPALEAGAFRA